MKALLWFLLLVAFLLVSSAAASAAPQLTVWQYKDGRWAPSHDNWSAKQPALLIHGFPFFNEGSCRDSLLELAGYLTQRGYTAYAVEYPKGFAIQETAAALCEIVQKKCKNWPKDAKMDIFAHSMGGLVVRCALECPKLMGVASISGRVARVVTMGTPHNGFSTVEIELFKKTFGPSPELDDMDSGKMFIRGWMNFPSEEKAKVSADYYSLIGRRSWRPAVFGADQSEAFANLFKWTRDNLAEVHDGLVEAGSAGYDLSPFCQSFTKAELDLNHDYIKSHAEVFATLDKWLGDTKFTGGMPILLGKTRAEVEQIIGHKPTFATDSRYYLTPFYASGKHGWQYGYDLRVRDKKYKQYTFTFIFIANAEIEPKLVYGRWDVAIVDGVKLSPEQVVPKEILDVKPDIICFAANELERNHLMVFWFLGGHMFCLDVYDTKRKLFDPLYKEEEKFSVERRYRLNANGQDFRHCDMVSRFYYLEDAPDLFKKSPVVELLAGSRMGTFPGGLNPFWTFDE